jgi:hypothetical protein
MPYAYPYIRFSSDIQKDGNSLLRQTKAIQAYLAENPHLEVDKRLNLEDLGKSGFAGQHLEKGGALHLFLEKIKKGEVEKGSVLIIEHFNRLSRLPLIKSITLFNEILANGVNIAVLEERQVFTAENLTSMDYLKAVLRFEVAHAESRDKSNKGIDNWKIKKQRLRDAEDPASARAEFTKTVPLWLIVEGRDIRIDEDKAVVVKLIFELCSRRNYGFMKIAKHLNENSIPRLDNSGRAWTFDIVKRLVHNRALIGEYQPRVSVRKEGRKRLEYIPSNEPPIEGVFPVVIDLALFDEVQAKTQSRKIGGGGRRADMPNLFLKLLRCNECGGSIKHQKHHNGYKEYRYLKCYNSLYGHCVSPGNRAWRYDEFEEMFFQYAGRLNLDEIFTAANSEIETVMAEVSSIEVALAKQERKIEGLVRQVYESETVSTTLNNLLVNLEQGVNISRQQLREKHQQLASLRSRDIEKHKETLRNSRELISQSQVEPQLRDKINAHLREIIASILIDFPSRYASVTFKSGVVREFHRDGIFANLAPKAEGEQREKDLAEIFAWHSLTDEEKARKYQEAGLNIVPLKVEL